MSNNAKICTTNCILDQRDDQQAPWAMIIIRVCQDWLCTVRFIFQRVNILFHPHFFPFMVVWGLGFGGWDLWLSFWGSGFMLMGFWGLWCTAFWVFFGGGGLGSSYKHVKINLEIWIVLAVSPQAYNNLLYAYEPAKLFYDIPREVPNQFSFHLLSLQTWNSTIRISI